MTGTFLVIHSCGISIMTRQNQIKTLGDQTRESVESALKRNRGNVSAAARQLGIGRATIYRLMQRHQIQNERRN